MEDGGEQVGAGGGSSDWLVPPGVGELEPAFGDGKIVSFTAFHRLGLGLPLHPFVWGLLFFYGLRLPDLTPEGILLIVTFITLCEAFLGIAPHFALWRWVF